MRTSAFALAALPFDLRAGRAVALPTALRIGVVAPLPDDAAARARAAGLELGLAEAQHAALLFGGSVELVPVTAGTRRLQGLSALIGGEDAEHCAALATAASEAGVVYLNVNCPSQSLRDGTCHRSVFHIIPSEAMYRDAAALAPQPGAVATAWHPSLERFGADTLNERFLARFHTPMSEHAWTAWFAMKALWEASLRARSTTPAALIDYLARDSTQFDGHKGRPLSFRAWDNQLRQPMYLVRNNPPDGAPTTTEVPVAAPDEPARESLDRLGGRGTNQPACAAAPHRK